MPSTGRVSRAERLRRLGVGRPITRRDFIDGIAATAAVAASAPVLAAVDPSGADTATQDRPGYYPPSLTGMRGSHAGSFEAAHALRDGTFPKSGAKAIDTGEHYDLIVVGGGISGLAAAYFYRAKAGARILILDNHDDFGGHAKRNEFELGGRTQLINGGTLGIDSPRPYSPVAAGLFAALGIDPAALAARHAERGFYASLGLGPGVFFDKETFGEDRLVKGKISSPGFLDQAPLSDAARRDIIRLETASIDYLPGLSSPEKKARLSRISYRDYLLDLVKADPSVVPLYQSRTHGEWGVGIDAVSALDIWAFGFPGFQGLDLAPGSAPHMGYTAAGYADGGSDTFHFPDGNASIARLLVRSLIPQAVPGETAEDVVTAHIDYGRLDRPDYAVRIRLGSLAISAHSNESAASPAAVEIVYSRLDRLYSARAKHCVLACWNMMIPYLCPQLPRKQKEALSYLVKVPLVYTNVALANWRAFVALGVDRISCPGSYHSSVRLNPVTNIGAYRAPRSPDEPILIQLVRTPCQPGLSERDQHRAGRYELLATEFVTFEEKIRDQLDRMLGPAGFDAARDITAITVNRWPHGYAYEYNPLFDPEWRNGEAPHEIGRARYGPIAIANSDAAAAAYTDAAIDQAHRAVEELLAG